MGTHRDKKNPICPYCHTEQDDIDEIDKIDLSIDPSMECHDCGEEFNVEIRYTTRNKK